MSNTMSEEELELNLIELFSKVTSLGFGMRLTKEEFAEAIKNGAIDHQEAAHEAMKLVGQYTLSKQIEELEELVHGRDTYVSSRLIKERIAELKAKEVN